MNVVQSLVRTTVNVSMVLSRTLVSVRLDIKEGTAKQVRIYSYIFSITLVLPSPSVL